MRHVSCRARSVACALALPLLACQPAAERSVPAAPPRVVIKRPKARPAAVEIQGLARSIAPRRMPADRLEVRLKTPEKYVEQRHRQWISVHLVATLRARRLAASRRIRRRGSRFHRDSAVGSETEDALGGLVGRGVGGGGSGGVGYGGGFGRLRVRRTRIPRVIIGRASVRGAGLGGGFSKPRPAPRGLAGRAVPRPRAVTRSLPRRGNLLAGEVDDNRRFAEFVAFLGRYASLLPQSYRLDVSERYVIQVQDRAGRSLPNTRVAVHGGRSLLFQGRTDSRGRLLFHPRTAAGAAGVTSFDVTFQYGRHQVAYRFPRSRARRPPPWQVRLAVAKMVGPVTLEVLFLLDTTGSMADEIHRIQATLLAITARIRRMPGKPRIRYGMVLYRDIKDAYVVRRHGFTADVKAFDAALRGVRAMGGDDYEESMNMGLYAAVEQMGWSPRALRLLFLVADAPPHLDYSHDVPYPVTLGAAAARGIKIFPTAASGLNKQGSLVMRQLAQYTGGKFLFIEYGASGARHGVTGPYNTNNLDDLVVRNVRAELLAYIR